jgi:hypothetical protein
MIDSLEGMPKEYKSPRSMNTNVYSLSSIFNFVDNCVSQIKEIISKYEVTTSRNMEILFLIRNITCEIYSACEITNEFFKTIYRDDVRYRGTSLLNGYNSNFKKIYKSHIQKSELKGVHNDKFLDDFYFQSVDWYVVLHDIRTQETHYELGEIVVVNSKLYYKNNNRNGVSKEIYTNPSDTIELELGEFLELVGKFTNTKIMLQM